jgi:hypothetical protein
LTITHSKYCTQESRKGCTLNQTSKTLNPKSGRKQLGISTTVQFAIVDLYLDVFRCFHFTLNFCLYFIFAVVVGVVVEADELVELLEDRQKLFASFRRSIFPLLLLDSVLKIENRFCLFGFNFNYFLLLFTDYLPFCLFLFILSFSVSLSFSLSLSLSLSLSVSLCHSLSQSFNLCCSQKLLN